MQTYASSYKPCVHFRSGRISPCTSSRSSSRAGSAKNSPHTSPLGSPRLNRSRHPSPLILNQPSSNQVSLIGDGCGCM